MKIPHVPVGICLNCDDKLRVEGDGPTLGILFAKCATCGKAIGSNHNEAYTVVWADYLFTASKNYLSAAMNQYIRCRSRMEALIKEEEDAVSQ